jgi:hypothetical protein
MPKFGFGLHITDHRPSIVLRRGPIGRALTVMRLQRLDRAKQRLFPSSLTSDAVAAVLGFRLPVAKLPPNARKLAEFYRLLRLGFFGARTKRLPKAIIMLALAAVPQNS